MFECLLAYREIFEAWGLSGQDVERLEREQVAYEEDKKRLTSVKEQIKQSETLLKRMEFQHEVLQQQLSQVQQRSGLKNLILEKKIDTVEEALETTEAQITELLASANVDPTTSAGITQKLDQVIAYKDDIVSQLEDEVQRIRDSHSTMVKTYESKMAEYGVPPEDRKCGHGRGALLPLMASKGRNGPTRPHVAVPRAVLLTKEDLENFHNNALSRDAVLSHVCYSL
eukprot:s301_g8.t1